MIAATGVLHHLKYPEIEGLDRFEGALFHSARWDHAVKLDGRRVGVVGTGSSAVQIVGAIVDRVAKLSLFQRTAQWIMPQENPAYSEAERAEFRRNPELVNQLHADMATLFAAFSNGLVDANSPQMKMIEDACLREPRAERARPGAAREAAPELPGRLQAPGDVGRLLPAPSSSRRPRSSPRASSASRRRACARATGACTSSTCWCWRPASASTASCARSSVIGRDGVALDAVWEKRPSAYLSISIPGFPNLFMLNGPNGPVGNFSLIEVAELQLGYVLQLVELLRSGRCREISPSEEATRAARGRAHRGRAPHDLGLRLPQLVPRRSRRADELALDLRPLPRRDGGAEARGLRAARLSAPARRAQAARAAASSATPESGSAGTSGGSEPMPMRGRWPLDRPAALHSRRPGPPSGPISTAPISCASLCRASRSTSCRVIGSCIKFRNRYRYCESCSRCRVQGGCGCWPSRAGRSWDRCPVARRPGTETASA